MTNPNGEEDDVNWDDLDWTIHHCHPRGSVGDTWVCPECGKTWAAEPTIMWKNVPT